MSYMIRNLLPLNLQFFAEDGGAGEGGSGDGGSWIDDYYSSNKGDSNKGDKGASNENMIPKSRFDEINSKYKELTDLSKTKQAEYDEMMKKMEESDSSKKQLEDSIKAGTTRIEALEGLIKGMLDSELEAIDEEFHELVPSDKPIEEQLDWLRKAKAKGIFGNKGMEFEIGQPSNPRNSGKGAGRTEGMSTMQLLTMGYSTK